MDSALTCLLNDEEWPDAQVIRVAMLETRITRVAECAEGYLAGEIIEKSISTSTLTQSESDVALLRRAPKQEFIQVRIQSLSRDTETL